MNTNMTGLRWFSKGLCILVHWMKVVLALEELIQEGAVVFSHLSFYGFLSPILSILPP